MLPLPPFLIAAVAAIPLGGMVSWLVVRHRKRAAAKAAALKEEADFEPIFPEGPEEQRGRRTTARRIARR
jgi:hypothetical protein